MYEYIDGFFRWTGPIELVIFLEESEDIWTMNDFLRQFLTCRSEFFCQVNVHPVLPIRTPAWKREYSKVSQLFAQASFFRGQWFDNDVCWKAFRDLDLLKVL